MLVVEAVTTLNTGVYIAIGRLVERVDQITSSIVNIEAISQPFLVLF